MDAPIINERQLLAEIDQLRERFPQTQDLYREVCVLLFFRHGITPTANKLYQLVRKGSMSAPAEALAKFWENLREKSRVRIEHPDLPEEIKAGAGELAATLWTLAQEKATASLREHEAEARASVMEANTARAAAETQHATITAKLDQIHTELQHEREQAGALRQQLAAEIATKEALETQLVKAQSDIAAHQQANESARRYFADEIEKLRTSAQIADERFRAAEKRALLEIDRERHTALKFQKELEAVRADAAKVMETHRSEINTLQQQLGDLRQQVGSLQGQLQAVTVTKDQFAQELKAAHAQAAECSARMASLELELHVWRNRAEVAEKTVDNLKAQSSTGRITRKAGKKAVDS